MIKPVGKNILVKEKSGEVQSATGVSFTATKKYGAVIEGEVVAIGDEVTKCKVGDIVIYLAKSGDELDREGAYIRYLMVEDMIRAIKVLDVE